MLLLLLSAVAQGPEPQPQHSLAIYLRIANTYVAADRAAAVREIREWPPAAIRAVVADVRGRNLRASSTSTYGIALDTIEAAVLLHAEAGLLALRETKADAARLHLNTAVSLRDWTRQAAAWGDLPRIDRGLFSLALAAGMAAAGQPSSARAFAEDARRVAPLDPDVQLGFGVVAEGLAQEEWMRGHEEAAARWRTQASLALDHAITLDAGLFPQPRTAAQPTSRGLEARLRLGRIALVDGRLEAARRWLEEVEAQSADDRQRHLAWLLLGRLAERQGRNGDAIVFYRRALEAWPASQVTALAWAHAVEGSSGPTAALPLVAKALTLPRLDSDTEPWRSYLFGPPGFAESSFDRLRRTALVE